MIVHGLVFYLFAAIVVASAVMVISARNPVHSVLFLILAFFNAAGLFLLMGAEAKAPLAFPVTLGFDYKKKEGRREWVRAFLQRDERGRATAIKFPREGAGILSSLVECDGLVQLPEELTRLEKGETADFLPFSELFQ